MPVQDEVLLPPAAILRRPLGVARPWRLCYARRVHVREWVILRGLSRERRQWGPFAEQLAERTGARVHALDLPGMGEAHALPSPITVGGIVEDLDRRLPSDLEGPVGLLGVSLGGMSTLEWCARRPGRFAAAVVINASAGNLSPPHHRMRPGTLPVLMRAGRLGPGVERERATLGLTTSHHGDNLALATLWAGYRESHPLRGPATARQLLAGLRFTAPAQLGAPTLFVSGKKDRFVHPRCTARLATRYGAAHVEHPTAGHDLSLDAGAWLLDRMATFLSEIPS